MAEGVSQSWHTWAQYWEIQILDVTGSHGYAAGVGLPPAGGGGGGGECMRGRRGCDLGMRELELPLGAGNEEEREAIDRNKWSVGTNETGERDDARETE